jgi:hypothetical protein
MRTAEAVEAASIQLRDAPELPACAPARRSYAGRRVRHGSLLLRAEDEIAEGARRFGLHARQDVLVDGHRESGVAWPSRLLTTFGTPDRRSRLHGCGEGHACADIAMIVQSNSQ